jgi:NTE family protein
MQRSKTALVLAGGGLAGAAYEIGALCAIDEALADRSVNEFDIYVGTSAGALVCACMANGLTPRMLLAVLERSLFGIGQLEPGHLFSLNVGDMFKRATRLPSALFALSRRLLSERFDASILDLFESLASALPNGLYDGAALERYLREALAQGGRSNRFADLTRELLIVATDLDTGERAVFGEPPLDTVLISQAVAASAAIPIFYRPVRVGQRDYIDGGIRGTASLDVAIERGAELIVCINPMVPFDNSAHPHGESISEQGLARIGNQVFRTFIHAGLHYHIKQLRRRYPHVDILLIEPRSDDYLMFDANTMRYQMRLTLARHGFESVAGQLRLHFAHYRSMLARHGISISTERIEQVRERLAAEGDDAELRPELVDGPPLALIAPPLVSAPAGLTQTLAELDRLLNRIERA